jgi:hypothetical protein
MKYCRDVNRIFPDPSFDPEKSKHKYLPILPYLPDCDDPLSSNIFEGEVISLLIQIKFFCSVVQHKHKNVCFTTHFNSS